MSVIGVTFRYEFGSAIDEAGLNAISTGLRVSRPDLFTHSSTVVVKPAPAGQPPSAAHLLTIYAVVTKPLAFNLYPVAGLPNLPADSLLVQAEITFSLTDSILGLITRIDVTAQAMANIQYSGDIATINLLSFDLIDIEGDQPAIQTQQVLPAEAKPLSSNKAIAPLSATISGQISNDSLADAFRAIINYLVELYLKDTLETCVASFPVPTLDKIIHFGGLGTIPIAGIFVRNKSFYLMAGNDLGAPSTFPAAPTTPADIRVGVSQTGMRRAIAAFLPLPVPIDAGSDSSVLHLTGNLSIPELNVSLPPGSNSIPVKVNIGGLLNLHVAIPIPVFGGTFSFDVPIPIDYLTQYDGRLFPTLSIDQYPTNPGATIKVSLAPDVSFLGDWVAFVVTDYRDYLSQKFAEAVKNGINQLLGNQFCNIPILGWIVCGVLDVSAEVLGYLTGAVLDYWASTILTALVNIIGRVLFLFIQSPSFNVLTFKQSDLFSAIGVSLASASLAIIENGRDGDLQLSAWIQDQGLPIPPVPGPVTPLPPPQPPPLPPYPGVPSLPTYNAAQFLPSLTLPTPAWAGVGRQSYSVKVNSPQHPEVNATFAVQFFIEQLPTGWRLSLLSSNADGTPRAECRAEYDAQNVLPRSLERVSYGSTATGSITTRQSVDMTQPGQVIGSFGVDGSPSLQLNIPTFQGVGLDCEDFAMFRFAHSALALVSAAKFGVISVADPHSASNWVREIPITLDIGEGSFSWAPTGAPLTNVPVWVVNATEEGKQTQAQIAKGGRGLLQLNVVTAESQIVMLRLS
jgi:hypothetical protein